MPRTVFPPSAIITAVSVSTRPRSWPGVNPSRCSTRDRAVVRPVRSAVSRNAAAPACAVTASPPAVTVKPLDHPVESFTRKVPLDMGLIWTSQPGFSQIEGTFHCPHTTLSQQDRETLRHSIQDASVTLHNNRGWTSPLHKAKIVSVKRPCAWRTAEPDVDLPWNHDPPILTCRPLRAPLIAVRRSVAKRARQATGWT